MLPGIIKAADSGQKPCMKTSIIQFNRFYFNLANESDDVELLQPTFSMGGAKNPITMYRQQTLNGNTPSMRIYINRMKKEFLADVLTISTRIQTQGLA